MASTSEKIRSLEIQGAHNVATAGLSHLKETILKSKATNAHMLLTELAVESRRLLGARPTEPMLYNLCHYMTNDSDLGKLPQYKAHLLEKAASLKTKINTHKEYINTVALNALRFPLKAYTHCHSNSVIDALAYAHKNKRKIIVHNTETRPLLQGRMTAIDLNKAGIHVNHYVDSAMRSAMKDCDAVLLGCDAITHTKVINKIGSELVCESAERMGIPVYIITHSLKYDPRSLHGKETPIEERDPKEIWPEAPRGIEVVNPAFEQIDPHLIQGIISELGIFAHKEFLTEVNKEYPWLQTKSIIG